MARFSPGLGVDPVLPLSGTIVWSSSDSSVAQVSSRGLVSAGGPGQAMLRVRYGEYSDSSLVYVGSSALTMVARFASIQAALGHTCGLTFDRRVLCWGSSWFGEIGAGHSRKFTATVSPAPVLNLSETVALSVGDRHTCALTMDASVFCWGEELSPASAVVAVVLSLPVRIGGDMRFSAVSAGGELACGIIQGAELLCWGFRFPGFKQLSTRAALASVSVGDSHACGLTHAGELFCFGSNEFGQLGVGDRFNRDTLAAALTDIRFSRVSAGRNYTCALSLGARAYCWGRGANGQLGLGDTNGRLVPTLIEDLSGVEQVDAGATHTCARTITGAAFCWGEDFRGQIGDGPFPLPNPTAVDLIRTAPTRVMISNHVSDITAAWGESSCALETSGVAYCWGFDNVGQLGTGRHDLAPGIQLRFKESPTAVRIFP